MSRFAVRIFRYIRQRKGLRILNNSRQERVYTREQKYMNNKLRVFTRLGIAGLMAGSLCVTSIAFGQAESKKKKNDSGKAATAEASDAGAKSAVSEKDKKFIKKAAKGGMMEVDMGKMASEKATNEDVKAFGKRMVEDHGKAGDELKSLAEKKGVKMPGKKQEMSWKSDKDYMDQMVKDHTKDLAEFQAEAKSGDDADLKAFAEKTAKMVEEHLNMAKETQGKLK